MCSAEYALELEAIKIAVFVFVKTVKVCHNLVHNVIHWKILDNHYVGYSH